MSDHTMSGYFRFLSLDTRDRLKREYGFNGLENCSVDMNRVRASGDFALANTVNDEIEQTLAEDRLNAARQRAWHEWGKSMGYTDSDQIPDEIARNYIRY